MNLTGSEKMRSVSVTDYLAGEAVARRKHEYIDGQIYAMVGGRYAHNLIASNVLIELGLLLKGTPCRALNSDSKVRIRTAASVSFYYPDASVVCGENIRTDEFQDAPGIVVEVLSQSTRRIDEGEKLQAYMKLPSLQVCILLEQDFPTAIVHRRIDSVFQQEILQGLDAVIDLPTINVHLPLAAIYAEVKFTAETEEEYGKEENKQMENE